MGSAQHARAGAGRMIRTRVRMIRAGSDDPGGGPDELEDRLVVAQDRMSGWRSGCPGRVRMIRDGVRMIRLQGGASVAFGRISRTVRAGVRIVRALSGSSGPPSGSSGHPGPWCFFLSVFMHVFRFRFSLLPSFFTVNSLVPEYA